MAEDSTFISMVYDELWFCLFANAFIVMLMLLTLDKLLLISHPTKGRGLSCLNTQLVSHSMKFACGGLDKNWTSHVWGKQPVLCHYSPWQDLHEEFIGQGHS